jgi:hypothetical protein
MTKKVCTNCFVRIDNGLRQFIEANATYNACSFCGSKAQEPIATELAELADFMKACLKDECDDAANWLPYESAEGGFQGKTWDTYDFLFDHLQIETASDELQTALVDALGDQTWCEQKPFSFSFGEDVLGPPRLLDAVWQWCHRFDLFVPLRSGCNWTF